jgi:hypothetical protein
VLFRVENLGPFSGHGHALYDRRRQLSSWHLQLPWDRSIESGATPGQPRDEMNRNGKKRIERAEMQNWQGFQTNRCFNRFQLSSINGVEK